MLAWAWLQLIEDGQISTSTSYFNNVNSYPEEACVQVQLNNFFVSIIIDVFL